MQYFIIGQKYRCVSRNQWVAMNEVCVADGVRTLLVPWASCPADSTGGWSGEKLRDGCPSIRGYNASDRTYSLQVDTSDFSLVIPEGDEMDIALENAKQRLDSGLSLSYLEHLALENAGVEMEDYVCPKDDRDGRWYMREDLAFCPLTEEYYSDEASFERGVDKHGDEIYAHSTAFHNRNWFYCSRSEKWWSCYNYTSVHVEDLGEVWCEEEFGELLSYCEYDGYWYYDVDEMPLEDEGYGNSIPSYHSQRRSWNVPDGITLGVELEVYVNDAVGAYENRPEGIIGERDGSLDDTCGVEFIGAPLNYEDYRVGGVWDKMLDVIQEYTDSDSFAQGDGYGMHISLGREPIAHDIQARFILFINNCQSFSEFVADRGQNRWAEYDKKDVKYVQETMGVLDKGDCWGGKYSATHVDRHRIEVRIFRSTIDKDMFQKNIDYVMSALDYATQHEDIAEVISVCHYLAWLGKQEKYDALRKFVGDKGSRFQEDDARRVALATQGFAIESTTDQPSI